MPIILVAAAVALVLLGTGVVLAITRSTGVVGTPPNPPPSTEPAQPTTQPPTDPPTGQPPTPVPPAGPRASDAVLGYLRAVASGNADAALRYSARPVAREATLTNAVLADSRRRAAISRIAVTPVTDPAATQVRANYVMGRTPVTTVYDVTQVNGTWKLTRVVNSLSLGLVRNSRVPMKVNGATVTSNSISVLPGSYAFTTGTPYLSYGSRNVLLVRSPSELVTGIFELRRELTPAGTRKVREEAQKSWRRCLAADVARPSNCPFSWTDTRYRYINGAVNWTRLGADPFRRANVVLDDRRGPGLSMDFRVRISGDCRFDGQRGTCQGTVTGTGVATIDLARRPLKLDWL